MEPCNHVDGALQSIYAPLWHLVIRWQNSDTGSIKFSSHLQGDSSKN
uniref:Uncharacterized protein n=1 Tax=Setaria italica TaxID=4555 RepID=K3Y478_SETIT